MFRPLGRRPFLKGVGGFTLALPVLPSLFGEARADVSAKPPRFIVIMLSNGHRAANTYPQESTASPFAWQTLAPDVRSLDLNSIQGDLSVVLGPSWNAFRSKMLWVSGLDILNYNFGGHKPHATLTSTPDFGGVVESIDQIMARSPKIYDSEPFLRSMHLGIRSSGGWSPWLSTKRVGDTKVNIAPLDNTETAFQQLFGNSANDPAERAKQAALKTRVLDRVRLDYQALLKSPRLGREDRQRLDLHMTSIDDLERRIATRAVVTGCEIPKAPVFGAPEDESTYLGNIRDQFANLSIAIRCGHTRIATFEFPYGDTCRFSFLPSGGPGIDHHSIAHRANSEGQTLTQLAEINRWYLDRVAEFLRTLDVVEEPATGRTYLDNSLVFVTSELGDGESHKDLDRIALLVGSAGGRLKTGSLIDFRRLNERRAFPYGSGPDRGEEVSFVGRPYNDLLISIMKVFGLTPADWESGPNPGFGDYSGDYYGQYVLGDRRSGLPFLTVG